MQSSQQCSQNNCVQRLTEWTLLGSWRLSRILLGVTKYISSVVVTVVVSKCLTKPKYKEANKNAVVASTWWLYYDQFDEAMQKKKKKSKFCFLYWPLMGSLRVNEVVYLNQVSDKYRMDMIFVLKYKTLYFWEK